MAGALAAPAVTDGAVDAANVQRLLDELARVGAEAPESRRARFVGVAVVAVGGRVWQAEGEAPGLILRAPRGTRGFGYDPVFWSTELGACFGEVPQEAKNRVSHRARAVSAVLAALGTDWGHR
jgi:XTP/dITP diphosphohydrolase